METKARENRYGVSEILEAIYFLRTEVSKLGPRSKLVSIKVSKDIEQRLIANFMQSPSSLYVYPDPRVLTYAGVKIEADEELPELERMIEVGGVWFGGAQIKQLIWLAAKAEKLENEAVRKSQLLQKRVEELEAENKKLREALEFYASKGKHELGTAPQFIELEDGKLTDKFGLIARQALGEVDK